MIRVYCGGKIAKNDWRHEIFRELRGAVDVPPGLRMAHPPRVGQFVYAGPFFLSCDHGCYHGKGTHGAATAQKEEEGCLGVVHSRREVLDFCSRWQRHSDVMFVWLDCATAFGTIAEIGYAYALGIPICLYHPEGLPELDDLWLVREMATYEDVAASPLLAWKDFTRIQGPAEALVRQQRSSRHLLVSLRALDASSEQGLDG